MIRELINEKRASAGLNGLDRVCGAAVIERGLDCSGEVLEMGEEVVWLKTFSGRRMVFRKDYDAWMKS